MSNKSKQEELKAIQVLLPGTIHTTLKTYATLKGISLKDLLSPVVIQSLKELAVKINAEMKEDFFDLLLLENDKNK